jgi:WD40 repeat protein/uncharacterized membrane protein
MPAKSNTGLIVGLLVLVLLLAGGGVGAYFYFRKDTPTPGYSSSTPASPKPPAAVPLIPEDPEEPVFDPPDQNEQQLLIKFLTAIQNGDKAQAEAIYQELKAANPNNTMLPDLRRVLDLKDDQFKNAGQAIQDLLKNPDHLDVLKPDEPKPNAKGLDLSPDGEMIIHPSGATALAFNVGAKRLVVGGKNGKLKVISGNDGEHQADLSGHSGAVDGIALTADGRYAATVSRDATAYFWDLSGNRQMYEFKGHMQGLSCVAFDARGLLVATAGKDGKVRLFDVVTAQLLKEFTEPKGPVKAVAFLPNSTKLLSAGENGQLLLWDYRSGTSAALRGHSRTINTLAISPDGQWLFSGGGLGEAFLWNLTKLELVKKLRAGEAEVTTANFSPNGHYLVAGSIDGHLRVFDVAHKVMVGEAATAHSGPITGALMDEDDVIASVGADGKLRKWMLPDVGEK